MRSSRFLRGAIVVSMVTALSGISIGAAAADGGDDEGGGTATLAVSPNSVNAGSTHSFTLTYQLQGSGEEDRAWNEGEGDGDDEGEGDEGVRCVVFTLNDFTNLSGPTTVTPSSGWSAALGAGSDQVTAKSYSESSTVSITVSADTPGSAEVANWTAQGYENHGCSESEAGLASANVTVTGTGGGPGTPCRCRPDMLIRLAGHPTWKGNNIYSGTGHNESIKVAAHAGQTWTVFLRGENDGTQPDNITISGAQSRPFIKVHYWHGFTNITSQVINHVYVQNLAPGEHTTLRMVVHLLPGVRPGVTRTFPVEGRSGIDFTKRDVVRFKTNIFRV